MSTGTTRPDRSSGAPLVVLAAAVAISGVAVGLSLSAALRHEREVRERQRAARAEEQRASCAERAALFVSRVPGHVGSLGPLDPRWQEVPAMEVRLNRQTDTMPVLEKATVESAEIRGVRDELNIAWKVSWADPTEDANVDTGRFTDAVAIQFPLTPGAAHTMGDHKQLVHILHWKGLWQRDVDEHFQDVQDLHPNYWTDLYWFADGTAPFRVPDDFSDPRSHQWFVAFRAGNPLADFLRSSPVEELAAEGFGTLTPHAESATAGKGVWHDGRWHVVFTRPMRTADPMDYRFWRGGTGSVGVAVWNGSGDNVGGRKHWGNWLEFEVSF